MKIKSRLLTMTLQDLVPASTSKLISYHSLFALPVLQTQRPLFCLMTHPALYGLMSFEFTAYSAKEFLLLVVHMVILISSPGRLFLLFQKQPFFPNFLSIIKSNLSPSYSYLYYWSFPLFVIQLYVVGALLFTVPSSASLFPKKCLVDI